MAAQFGKDRELLLICKSGARAAMAQKKFNTCGVPSGSSVEGGTSAWAAAGCPVVRGKKSISLERQVRIAAGFLVVLGVVGTLLHPAAIGLSAFVGAGLMFAGITDTCAMGMLIAKMPWNR